MHHHPIPSWFGDAKFGVFIHFAASGHYAYYGEKLGLNSSGYNSYADSSLYIEGGKAFTLEPEHVQNWAKQIKKWGAKYAVLTASHHPGFSLWNSKVTERTVTKMTPAKFDIVDVWTRSLRENDVKVGIYFNHEDNGSQLMWNALNDTIAETLNETESWPKYIEQRNERVSELVSNYGDIDLLWFDADWVAPDPEQLGTEKLVNMVVKKQPNVVLNNRLRSRYHGHYSTPEKYVPVTPRENESWEVCDNLRNNSLWGSGIGDDFQNYKTPQEVIYTFVDVLTLGGNYLLNIGPRPDGIIPDQEMKIMNALGAFINQNAEAIYGSKMGLPRTMFGEGSTRKGTTVYLFSNQNNGWLTIKGVQNEVKGITRLSDGKTLDYKKVGGRPNHGRAAYIRVPVLSNTSTVPVVYKVEFAGDSLQFDK